MWCGGDDCRTSRVRGDPHGVCEQRAGPESRGYGMARLAWSEPLGLSAGRTILSRQGPVRPGAQVHGEVHRPLAGSQDHQSEECQGPGEAAALGQPVPWATLRAPMLPSWPPGPMLPQAPHADQE